LVAELDAKAELLDLLEGNCCDCDEWWMSLWGWRLNLG
jgi:hypothetical protein